MTFTPTQVKELSQWEGHFKTMVESNFTRNIGRDDISRMDGIWNDAFNQSRHTNSRCGACIAELIQDIAPRYFADKAEMARKEARKAAKAEGQAKSQA